MKNKSLLITIMMLMLSVSPASADIAIVAFDEGKPSHALQQRVLDKNGDFCALIKLYSDVQGIMVDATQSRDTRNKTAVQGVYLVEQQCEAHPDEVWIYVSEKTSRLRLFHAQYGGMKEGSAGVRSGYYYLPISIQSEKIYKMEIRYDDASTPLLSGVSELPALVDAQFGCDDIAARMYMDGSYVRSGNHYLLSTGEHVFKARRPFYKTHKQKIEATPNQPLNLTASLTRNPINLFGGIEVGKPTSYSNLAYGVRVGIECGFGLYVSYLTTIGNNADGDAAQIKNLQYEPFPPYTDPRCQYTHWNVGMLLNCYASWHVYAGVGQATRSVNWKGRDNKRHEYEADRFSGFAAEAGVMYNVNRFYLSAGADLVDGSIGGRMGFGVFLNLLN